MSINRRTFLLNSAKLGIVVSSMPLMISCGGVTRSDTGGEANTAKLQDAIGKEGVEILRMASLAPNGHNTQPWTVKIVEPTRWVIGSDPTRWLPAVDPENRETMLSIGAFLENLVTAAEYFGYEVKLDIVAQSAKDTDIVHVTLVKGIQRNHKLDTICFRRTVRDGFLAEELRSEDLRFITSADSERFHYFSPSSPQGKYLAEGTLEANRIQVYRDPAQEELADWIRWSNDEARQHRDGLTPASMEISGLAGWYVRSFYNRSSVLSKNFRETTLKKVAEQVGTSGGWIVISSEKIEESAPEKSRKNEQMDNITAASTTTALPELLETGRFFQRMFLKAHERMIGVHPMTQMLEETPSVHQISQELGLNGPVQFILRTGYLKSYPEPVSLRRPVSWFTRS